MSIVTTEHRVLIYFDNFSDTIGAQESEAFLISPNFQFRIRFEFSPYYSKWKMTMYLITLNDVPNNSKMKGIISLRNSDSKEWDIPVKKFSLNTIRRKNFCLYVTSDHELPGDIDLELYLPDDTLTIECVMSISEMSDTVIDRHLLNEQETNKEFETMVDQKQKDVSELQLNNRSDLVKDFKNMYIRKLQCDVVIEVGKHVMNAHSCILNSRSPGLCKRLQINSGSAQITGFDVQVFDCFIKFLYSGQITDTEITDTDLEALYLIAVEYDVVNLQELCIPLMGNRLSVESVFRVFSLARACTDHESEKITKNFILKNLKKIILKPVWAKFVKSYPQDAEEISNSFGDNHTFDTKILYPFSLLQKNKSDLLSDLKNLHRSNYLTDVKFQIGNQVLHAHKCVLSCRSPVFEKMLEHDMMEKNSNSILIGDFNLKVFEIFLKFLYCGELEDTKSMDFDSVEDLYALGDKYDVPGLRKLCIPAMFTILNADNACRVLMFGKSHHDAESVTFAKKFILSNFKQNVSKPGWAALVMSYPEVADEIANDFWKSFP